MIDRISDAMLLERFVIGREEAAFSALVERHGPSVLGACRRILRNEHEAEEVLQATFLVLARKAPEMEWRDSVGGWLCAVAQRLSLHARADSARRRSREGAPLASADRGCDFLPEEHHPSADPMAEIERRDLRRVLDEELGCLPEKYRDPVILCYLEGMTNEEAARRLGCPAGSMSRRLERARSLLKPRLIGRGLVLALVMACGTLAVLRTPPAPGPDFGPSAGARAFKVRQAMLPFRSESESGLPIEHLFRWIREGGGGRAPDRRDLFAAARQSILAAGRIEDQAPPGADASTEWRRHVGELRQAAFALDLAARGDDDALLLASAQRLGSACSQCHASCRQ